MTFTPPTTSDKFEMFCVAMHRTERNTMLLDSWTDILGGESELRRFFDEFIYSGLCKRQNNNNGVGELVNSRGMQRAVDEVVPLFLESARGSLSLDGRGNYARGYNDPDIKRLLALIEACGAPTHRVSRDYVSWINFEDRVLIWDIARRVAERDNLEFAAGSLFKMPRDFALTLTPEDYERADKIISDYQPLGVDRFMYATVGKFPNGVLAGMSSGELLHVLEVVALLPEGVTWDAVKIFIDNDIDADLARSFTSSNGAL